MKRDEATIYIDGKQIGAARDVVIIVDETIAESPEQRKRRQERNKRKRERRTLRRK
jgi:hypothetical protein